jgi:type II secretory pathway component PulL
MERRTYFLSAHPICQEGVLLNKRGPELQVTQSLPTRWVPPVAMAEGDDQLLPESQTFRGRLQTYLQEQRLREPNVLFLVPAAEISFRKISFPFQDPRKIEQVLPFELGNEVLGSLDEYHYAHTVDAKSDGTAQALVMLMRQERWRELQEACEHLELNLQGFHCTATFLASFLSREAQQGHTFQLYVGADECFVNILEQGQLQMVKVFPNRIAELIATWKQRYSVELGTFLRNFALTPRAEDSPAEFAEIEAELRWLCSQITLFFRTQQHHKDIAIAVHGILGPLLEWDGWRFQLSPLPVKSVFALEEHTASVTPPLAEDADSPDSGRARGHELVEVRYQEAALALEGRERWGILGETPRTFRNTLERHRLSLYSQGTPLQRFLKGHRWSLVASVLLLTLSSGLFAVNQMLRLDAVETQIQQLDVRLADRAQQLLPGENADDPDQVATRLQNMIQQRQQEVELSKEFASRTYTHLRLLQQMSELTDNSTEFRIDRVEVSEDRFSMNGAIDSYENLQRVKTQLQSLPIFVEKRLVESNRKSQEGILYRITIEL